MALRVHPEPCLYVQAWPVQAWPAAFTPFTLAGARLVGVLGGLAIFLP